MSGRWICSERHTGKSAARLRQLPRGDGGHDQLAIGFGRAVLLGAEAILEGAGFHPAGVGMHHQHQHATGLHLFCEEGGDIHIFTQGRRDGDGRALRRVAMVAILAYRLLFTSARVGMAGAAPWRVT